MDEPGGHDKPEKDKYCVVSLKCELLEIESRMVLARDWGHVKWRELGHGHKFSVIR